MTRIQHDDVSVAVIIQTIGGDLRLRGRGGSSLIVDGDDPHVEQLAEGQPLVVNSGGDCRITVPHDVDVSVQAVGGDAKLTDLGGKTDVKNVGGDLTLRSVRDVQIKTVGGNLRLKWAEGNVTVESVGSDATIREVSQAVWIASVGSDLYVRNIQGGCVAEHIGSDLVLNIEFLPDHEYRFNVGGDILCRVHPDTNARFVLPADMNVALDVAAEVTESDDKEQQFVTVGDGSATIEIQGDGELRLVGEEKDYVFDLGIHIEEELEARLSSLEEKLSQQLDGLDEQIKSKTQHLASQAERMAQRAQVQAERAAERVRRSLERRKGGKRKPGAKRTIGVGWGITPPSSPPPPTEPVSEEERLMILRMVQENTISIEEAERLLSALDK